jgi:hypothetical protein
MNAGIGRLHRELVDGLATFQADLLRRAAAAMADGLDREAMLAVEGASDWRDPSSKRRQQS